jgi:hypothetical protein
MTVRTIETTVTFAHPFKMASFDEALPAGTYRLVSDEEEIPGLSFLAFRRTATLLHLPAIADPSTDRQVVGVDPDELEAMLAADARPA